MIIKENYYNKMSVAVIITIGIILTLVVILRPVTRSGEVDSIMLPAISIEQRLSFFINQSDIDKAQIDFPDMYQGVKTFDDLRSAKLVVVEDNKWISWYFPTYSITVLPIKILLKFIGANQSRAFLLTNILFFLLSLCVVYKKLKASDKTVFFTILLLVFNPILFYIIMWSTAESLIFSFVALSLVFFSNKEYKKAGLFVSLAGSLNPTIMIYGAMIIVSYFIDIYNNRNKEKFSLIILIRKKIFDVLLLGICFIPSIIPFIFNYIVIGRLNPTTIQGSAHNIWQRFFAYIFDLNLGFLPFVPIILIMFIVLGIIGIYKKNVQSFLFFISLFGTVLAFSIMSHINSGMTGISRYDAWSAPIMIFFITTIGYTFIKSDFLNKAFTVMIYLSAIISFSILVDYSRPPRHDYTYHNSIASFILNNVPQLYNPFYAIFISRTEHIDGGYNYTKPVIYTDNGNCIRKILVTSSTISELMNMVKGDNRSLKILRDRIDKIKNKEGYHYINIPRYSECVLYK